jgi:hypothetical protein
MQRSKIAITDLVDDKGGTTRDDNVGSLLPVLHGTATAAAPHGGGARRPQFDVDKSRSIRSIVNAISHDREAPTSDLYASSSEDGCRVFRCHANISARTSTSISLHWSTGGTTRAGTTRYQQGSRSVERSMST